MVGPDGYFLAREILAGCYNQQILPDQYCQHLGTILHYQVKDPNFGQGVERSFGAELRKLTNYYPESKFEDQTQMIPSH
jgi:hypothetical protein